MSISTIIPTENVKTVASTPVDASEVDIPVRSTRGDNHINFYHRKGDMVWRLFYDDSTFNHDGRYRCVAYCRNEADGLTEYGAAVFKKDDGCTFNKRRVRRELSHTARHRFQKRPVRLVLNEVTDRADLQKRLTKAMFRYGVSAERVSDDSEKLTVHGTM